MKIGLFGGTFDPIHNAHLTIARCAKTEYNLDRLIIMPCGNPPHKLAITDKHIRYQMAKIAIDVEFEVSDYEISRDEYSYTLTTLTHFKREYPDDEIFLIIGEDSLVDINSWYKPEEIIKLCTLLVFPRISKESLVANIKKVSDALGGNILPIDAPVLSISSTDIRKKLQSGISVNDMVPHSVVRFIEENNVY